MTPRVSDVLALLYPGSLDWVTEGALDRGTWKHQEMEVYLNNLIFLGPSQYPKDPCALKAAMWLETQHPPFIPLATEAEYVSKLGYIGHPDLIVGRQALALRIKNLTIDWKFAEAISPPNLMQQEVYKHLTGYPCWLVQVTKDLKLTVHKGTKGRPDLWTAFLSGLQVLKFQQKHRVQLTDVEITQQAHEVMQAIGDQPTDG